MLEKYVDSIYKCSLCGLCREFVWGEGERLEHTYEVELICPIREHTSGFEGYYARGKVLIAKGILEGKLRLSNSLINRVYACTTCGNCTEHCPSGVDVTRIIESLRTYIVKRNLELKPHKTMAQRVMDQFNPYGEKAEDRLSWMRGTAPTLNKNDTIYFVGCTSSYRRMEIAQATVNLLKKTHTPFTILKNERCCGSPLLRTGWEKLAIDLMKHNIEEIKRAGAKRVIFSCAGCYRTFKVDYPEIFDETLDFEILHLTEFIEELIAANRLKIGGKIALKIAYHDPCHLGRHAGVYDQPRKVIKKIPGIEMLEFYPKRENAICCGAGGGVKIAYNDIAINIAKNKVKKAEEMKADAIASACPFCKHNFLKAVESMKSTLKVYDVTELLNMATFT